MAPLISARKLQEIPRIFAVGEETI